MSIVHLQKVDVYQKDFLVLEKVTFQITTGEFVFLIGATGSGKSSLLKTLYADLPLQEGEAEIVGHYLSSLKNSTIPFLRRKIGVVFQDFQLLSDRSVYDNLSFVLNATNWKDKKSMDERIHLV